MVSVERSKLCLFVVRFFLSCRNLDNDVDGCYFKLISSFWDLSDEEQLVNVRHLATNRYQRRP